MNAQQVLEACIADGTHLKSCDADGFCNVCGHQLSAPQQYVPPSPAKGQRVAARGIKRPAGIVIGLRQFCTLEGCGAQRLIVRWPGSKVTHPCLKGCDWDRTAQCWRIL